jgi:molecular chaperone GrpE
MCHHAFDTYSFKFMSTGASMQTQQQWNESALSGTSATYRTEPTLDINQLMSGSSPESETPPPQPAAPPPQSVAPQEQATVQPDQPDSDATIRNSEDNSKAIELELREKLANAEAKAAELQESLMRAKADVENFRRRAQEDVTRAHKFAIEGFAESLVPVKDSLETALKIDTPTLGSIKEGVEMTLKQLNTAFERNRLTEICPLQGEKLDPMKHQAISMVPVDQNPNTIISVLQKGYMIADRLLRPALVTVSQGKSNENQA